MTIKNIVLGMISLSLLAVSAPVLAGPAADLNQDGQISQAEMIAQIDKHFQATDTNKDGKLSQAEWQAQKASRMQQRGNKANKQHRANKQGADNPQWAAKRAERQAKHFAMLDTNKDGFISLAEAKAVAQQRFQKQDANNDGQISKDERGRKGHQGRKGKASQK